MDKSSVSSELEDGVAGLSMSLVSYGSDLDASVSDIKPNLDNSISNADTLSDGEPSTPRDDTINAWRLRSQQLSLSGLTDKKKKEVEAALAEATSARLELLGKEEISRALETVISSGKLPQQTRENLQKLRRRQEVQRYVGENPGLLGLTEEHLWADCPRQLSETDQKIVRLAVESQLIETARELKQSQLSKQEILNKLSGNASSCSGVKAESDHTAQMASLRTQLNNEIDQFCKHLVLLDSLLDTIVQMRTTKMTKTSSKIIEGYEAKALLLKQKAQLITVQIQSSIYTEDSHIVPAVQCLEKDLDLLHAEMETELSECKGLLAAYDRVRCPEYDKIVDEYRCVMKEIKSLQYLLRDKDLMPNF